MKDTTKTIIAREVHRAYNWCTDVEAASKLLEDMPGITPTVKAIFVAFGSIAGMLLPAWIFKHFYDVASQTLDGAAIITHALKLIAEWAGWSDPSMLLGIVTLIISIGVACVATAAIGYAVNEIVKWLQKTESEFRINVMLAEVEEFKSRLQRLIKDPASATLFNLNELFHNAEMVANTMGVDVVQLDKFEVETFVTSAKKDFKDENELRAKLRLQVIPGLSLLRTYHDIPAGTKDELKFSNDNQFVNYLRIAGVKNFKDFKGTPELKRIEVYVREVKKLCFN